MTSILQADQTQAITGLDTWSATIITAGTYEVRCEVSLLQGSGLQIVLSRTGSASSSVTVGGASTNPAQTQPMLGTSASFLCAAADVVSVALTSSNAVDSQANAIKGSITIFRRGA